MKSSTTIISRAVRRKSAFTALWLLLGTVLATPLFAAAVTADKADYHLAPSSQFEN